MRPDLLSLADAAVVLRVSPERVRQLVVAGDLPGERFGNAWVVPKAAVTSRLHAAAGGGRPLGVGRAWREILDGAVDLGRSGRYLRRAMVVRCEMSRADREYLVTHLGAMEGGVRAAVEYGAGLVESDEFDVYVPRELFDGLHGLVAMVNDAFGSTRLRVVPDAVWGALPPNHVVPRGAVALDLYESGDPRHWSAAEKLLRLG